MSIGYLVKFMILLMYLLVLSQFHSLIVLCSSRLILPYDFVDCLVKSM